ncbi:Cytochrome P [Parasponia andersonii]|uniref:Cytochrome P n=1 Tax=Parasponia andersonii TaxID=3476 RepID=A0A2P5AJB4_PARAD|nr:Cytochrome P [Parasponia andersonii]
MVTIHSAKEDILSSGKRNTRIMISFYSMGRIEEICKDYLEFKLERWISKSEGFVYVPSYKFIAFN